MKSVISLLLFFVSLFCFSQKTSEIINSKKLGQDRELFIQLPDSYEKDPSRKFPLLFVLDAEYLFDPITGAIRYGSYWDDLPEVIVVGLCQNKNQERYADTKYDVETGLPKETGANFFDFIGTELISHLEKKYRIAPFKIIVGHDNTAGFMNFFLYKEIPLFDAYISLSPELATNMEKFIPERIAIIKKPIYYYLSTADGDVKKMQKRIREMDEKLKTIQSPTLKYKFDDFIGATHYSLVLHSIPNALYHFFDMYQPISTFEFQEKIVKLPSGYVDYLIEKYAVLEKSLHIKMPIRLNDFKAIEAAILKNKAYDEFDKLSDLARKNYPKSMLPDYHLALMYENKGDYKRAQKAYLSAFQKEPIGDLDKDLMYDRSEELKKMN